MADVDRSGVRRGDTITYRSVAGDAEVSAVVEFATRSAVTVTLRGMRLPIDWRRVCGHHPQQRREEGQPCPA